MEGLNEIKHVGTVWTVTDFYRVLAMGLALF